nr:MAG TPA: hypothetical protein [Caudoviricetes sp.]
MNNAIRSEKEPIICSTHDFFYHISAFFVCHIKVDRFTIILDAFSGVGEELRIYFRHLIHDLLDQARRISAFFELCLACFLVVDLVEETEEREKGCLNVLSVVGVDP